MGSVPRVLFFGLLLLVSGNVWSQAAPSLLPQSMRICVEEASSPCKEDSDVGKTLQCLAQHKKELSIACQQSLDRYAEQRTQSNARSGGALGSFGGLNSMGRPIPAFSYDGKFNFGESNPTFTEDKINLSSPVYHQGADTVALSLAAGQLHLGQNMYLNSGQQVSTDLTRVEIGGQYSRQLDAGKNFGVRASLGYAGDAPSNAFSDLAYSITANYGFPGSAKDYWLIMGFLSNMSPFLNNIPFPGFDYIYKTPTFTGMFGLPLLSMQWTPVDPWIFSFSAFGLSIQSEIAYGHREGLQLFTAYNWIRQYYIPSQRPSYNDRMTVEEQKWGAGIRYPIADLIFTELQAGRSFIRSIYVGSSGNTEGGTITLPGDWFASLSAKYIF